MNGRSIDQTINHLFRQESGKMVSVLVRIFGSEHLELVEDVVQDALVTALETWKFRGLPDNPRAWLYKTARNRAIDIIRRKKHVIAFDFTSPDHSLLNSEYTLSAVMDRFWEETQIRDDFLAMMYACCHPDISAEHQITFILKYLGGFSTREIAKAFLTSEDTVTKRLYRTKEHFRKTGRPSIPSKAEIPSRSEHVLSAIYLMFNEGYSSTHSDELIREDIIAQAMFLCKAILDNPLTQLPEAYALMALMCFHTSRSAGRVTSEGELVLLSAQDRSVWDRDLIDLGQYYLAQSAFGNAISMYHLEAAIAHEHCIAKGYAQTNWARILKCYDTMLTLAPANTVIALNRCIVLMELYGADHALHALQKITADGELENYYLFHSISGELHARKGEFALAQVSFARALALTHSEHEKQFLSARIAETQRQLES